MRLPFLALTLFVVINLLVDWYIYSALRHRLSSKLWSWLYLASSVALTALIIVVMCAPKTLLQPQGIVHLMWMVFIYGAFYLPRYVFVIFDLTASVPMLFGKKRLSWLSCLGLLGAVVLFFAIWWGALINRFNIKVNEVDVPMAGLPENFNGFRIAQISDLHVGTFGENSAFLEKLVAEVNALHPDVVVFTGDIVNTRASELDPHATALAGLKAPYGVYSILGNHDHGDYSRWDSEADKTANLDHLLQLQRGMGWHLLDNEHVYLHRGNDSIALIGVDNIGDPPFPVYGSLSKAYPELNDSVTKVLLTHNPAHWTNSIADRPDVNIPLTLSGHTHAMQISVGNWSPSKYRYSTWGGKYSDKTDTHTLYVNIGAGTVGFPMRLGATPEITLLTLTNLH